MTRRLAREEGVLVGISSGAALGARRLDGRRATSRLRGRGRDDLSATAANATCRSGSGARARVRRL